MLAEHLEVHSIDHIARRIGNAKFGRLKIATDDQIKELLKEEAQAVTESRFTQNFVWDEWSNVVDAWQLKKWEEYRDVRRLGRKTRLAETQRKLLWGRFESVRKKLFDQSFSPMENIRLISLWWMRRRTSVSLNFDS